MFRISFSSLFFCVNPRLKKKRHFVVGAIPSYSGREAAVLEEGPPVVFGEEPAVFDEEGEEDVFCELLLTNSLIVSAHADGFSNMRK